ncbi:MAG TPA: MBL fold metallo-hydrolase [Balneolales bacterium]|nr:MBL fold metallo-hydrolase [Balneolales bacterium]
MNEHHIPNGFRNPFATESRGFADIWRWMSERRGNPGKKISLHPRSVDLDFIHENRTKPLIIWLGHSAFLLQIDGVNILTDPMLGERASPFPLVGPVRYTPPAIKAEDLPVIDLVLVSHNHYDHLDSGTIKQLLEQQHDNQPHFYVPLGLKDWFTDMGAQSITELDWWNEDQWRDYHVIAVPGQHFSGRGLGDHNATLWCGWVIRNEVFSYYFAGDSGYCLYFKEIGDRLGPMSLSTIPIGAYKPRWFMKAVHVNPEEAVKIHQDVRSQFSIGMHWGTFKLTDEDMDEPPRKLRRAVKESGLDEKEFITVDPGQIIHLDTVLKTTSNVISNE